MEYSLNEKIGGVVGLKINQKKGWSPFRSSNLSNFGVAKVELVVSLSTNIESPMAAVTEETLVVDYS